MRISTIAISYEEKSPAVVREIMALKAALEPMLMRQVMAVIMAQRAMARRGRAEPDALEFIYFSYVSNDGTCKQGGAVFVHEIGNQRMEFLCPSLVPR